jgi:hypothetical protein
MIIKTFGRHFVVRALVIIIIQLGFIWAKLGGLLTWQWLWVFTPLLLTAAVLAIFLCVAAFIILGN